jgi:hypothetical protein
MWRTGNAGASRAHYGNDKQEEARMPKGLLFMAFDFSTAHADEFHDWYDQEHVPERLRVPGFLNAERWIDDDNPMVHVATYDLESAGVLSSPPYRAVGGTNQSVWTKRVTSMCRRIMRYEGEQLVPGDQTPGDQTGAPGAGALLVASMTPDADAEAEFNDWYDNEHLPNLSRVPGVLSARRFRATDTESERRYLSLYHLNDRDVSRSDAWATASNTQWTERMRPRLRDLLVIRMHRYQRKA